MFYDLVLKADPQFRTYGSSTSTKPLFVPPGQTVLLSITSPGYTKWPGDESGDHGFTLKPGETRVLRIALRPIP